MGGFRPAPVERILEPNSKRCRIKKWLFTAANAPSEIGTLVRLGFGGKSGWHLNPTLSALNLPSIRQNMKKKLQSQKATLTKLSQNVIRSSKIMQNYKKIRMRLLDNLNLVEMLSRN